MELWIWKWIGVTLLISVLTSILTYVRNNYCYAKGKEYNGKIVVSDILHNLFENKPYYGVIGDSIFIGSIIIYVCYFLYYKDYDYLIYFAIMANIILILNVLYACSTVLPDSKNGDCSFSDGILNTIQNVGTCNDLNMSGHLMITIIAFYTISLYQRHQYLIYYMILFVISFFTIAVSRNHYTVDCLNSVFFSILLLTYRRDLLKWIAFIFHITPLKFL
jgi:hypothetical protein